MRKVAGKALGLLGDPIEEALVEIETADGVRIAAQFTDNQGNFEFEDLKEGKYKLRIGMPLATLIEANYSGYKVRKTQSRICTQSCQIS